MFRKVVNMNRLENKVAIVTASTRGIGLATAESFAKEGAIVYLAVRNTELGETVAEELRADGGTVKVVYFDAVEDASYETMVDTVLENEGRIDVLVNNFGGSNPKYDRDIMNSKYENFIKSVDTNLKSVFVTSQLVINKAMSKQNSGSIINIGSVAGVISDLTQCAYGTAKAGIIHLSKMISVHAARYNIRCNVVCPGMTATEAVENHMTEDYKAVFMKHTPLRRMAEPTEIAAAVLYFAGDEAAFTTGQVLTVSGGYGFAAPTYGDMINANLK